MVNQYSPETAPIIYHLRRTIHIIKVAMRDKLCFPRSPRNLLRVVSSRCHDSCMVMSVICERSLTYSWHRVCVLSSPYCCHREAKQKRRCIRHLLCFVSELSSSTKPAKSDTVQNFGYRGYSNRDIIGTAISFLSDIHFVI